MEKTSLGLSSAYNVVPATFLGRMAVCVNQQRKGFARYMIASALEMCRQSPSATRGLVVDAKNEAVLGFYLKLGFVRLGESSLRVVLLLPKSSLQR